MLVVHTLEIVVWDVSNLSAKKKWKNRSAKAMSKMLANQVDFGQNEFEEATF